MPNVHELTIDPGHFDRVATGIKTAEIRKDDHGYTVGDTLLLQEWVPFDPMNERRDAVGYTGRVCRVKVTDIARLEDGFVALSIRLQAETDRLVALERLYEAVKRREELAYRGYDYDGISAHVDEFRQALRDEDVVLSDLAKLEAADANG